MKTKALPVSKEACIKLTLQAIEHLVLLMSTPRLGCLKVLTLLFSVGILSANSLKTGKRIVTLSLLQIKSIPQVEAAFEYLATVGRDELDVAEFEKKTGVGALYTPV